MGHVCIVLLVFSVQLCLLFVFLFALHVVAAVVEVVALACIRMGSNHNPLSFAAVLSSSLLTS